MSELPKSWYAVNIECVLKVINNGKVIMQGWSPQCEKEPANLEEWGVLKTTAIQEGFFLSNENKKLPKKLSPKLAIEVTSGDILMTCAGPRNRCGITCLVKDTRPRLMISGKMYAFRAEPQKINPAYLGFFLLSQNAKVAINQMKTGISDSGLNLTHGKFLKLPVPIAPLNEQKRIVVKIEELFSELDKGVENLKNAQNQLKVYRQCVLKYAFEGKLTAQWREENKDQLETADKLLERIKREREAHYQQQLKDYNNAIKEGRSASKPKEPADLKPLSDENLLWLSDMPNGWTWERLGWITCGIEYGTGAKSSDFGEIPVLRMGNIQNMKFDWEDLVYTSDPNEISNYSLKKGDVLFNRTNSPELVGKTAIYHGERPAVFAGYLMRVNQIENIVDARYLNYYLNSYTAKQYGNTIKTDGVNQSNINGKKLAHYPFPYCHLKEQKVIVELLENILSLIDQTELDIRNQLQKSESLRQAILTKAFSGQLVSQDSHDEPTNILLDRIHSSRKSH